MVQIFQFVMMQKKIVESIGEMFGKLAASTAMRISREILRGRENV